MMSSRTGTDSARASGRELAASFLFYLGVSVWWLYPLAQVMEDHLPNHAARQPLVFADLELVVWALAWGSRALVTQPLEIFDANIFYPMPDSLAFSDHFFGLLPLFAPFYWVTDNPVMSANMTILAIFALRALSMQILLRRYTGPEAAILGALFFSFTPNAADGIVKFYLLATFGLVLSFFLVDRLLASPRVRDMVGLALMLSMQAATSVYLAFAAMFGTVAWTLSFLWFRRTELDARRIVGLLVAAGMAGLILVPLHLPYLRFDDGSILPDYLRTTGENWSMSQAINFFHLRRFATLSVPPIVWLFAGLALFPRRRMPMAPIVGSIFVALTSLTLSLGPEGRLLGIPTGAVYVFLADIVPGMSAVRAPFRFLTLCTIAIPLLAGLGLHSVLFGLGQWPRRIVAILIGGFYLGVYAPQAQPMRLVERGEAPGHVYAALAKRDDGRAVLEIPRAPWGIAAQRMLGSTTHWHPIIDGYSGHPPESDDLIQEVAKDLPSAAALQRLVDTVDVGWIVVHRDQLRGLKRQEWRRPNLSGLVKTGNFGTSDLYRVDLSGDRDRHDLLTSRTLTMEGNSRADLGDVCPGKIELLSIKRLERNPKVLNFRVRLRNFGPRAWPGLGAYRNGLVRLGVCGVHARSCGGKGIRLLGDVPAGGELEQSVNWLIPRSRKPKKLRVELFQEGGPNLESCGVKPLIIHLPAPAAKPRKYPAEKPPT